MTRLAMDGPGSRHGRQHRALTTLVAVAAAGVAGAAFVADATAASSPTSPIDPRISLRLQHAADRVPVIVTMREQVDVSTLAGRPEELGRALRRAARVQAPVLRILGPDARRLWIINAAAGRVDPRSLRLLKAHPAVASVRLDTRTGAQALAVTPLADLGTGNWGIADVKASAAWSRGVTGKGVRIGSIDTGVDPANPALAGRIAGFRDFINGRPAAYDDNGHGTHTVGVMVGGKAFGTPLGVAPDATVLVAKAMDADGVGPGSTLIEAAQWMADPDGNPATRDEPAVVNNSWSAPDPNDPWFRSILRVWQALGIVPVFAAGNAGTIGSPAGYPDVITVGAHDQQRTVPSFSGRASFAWEALDATGPAPGTLVSKPDVTAPGVAIMSTYGTGYMAFTGTSMAAPHVAGIVALLRQAKPDLTPAAALEVIRASATDIQAPGPELATGTGAANAEVAVGLLLGASPTPADAPVTGDTIVIPEHLLSRVVVRPSKPRGLVVTGRALVGSTVRVVIRRGPGARAVASRSVRARKGATFRLRITPPKGSYRVEVSGSSSTVTRVERIVRVSVK